MAMQYATKGTGSVLPVWSTATSFLARWLVAVSVPAVNGKRGRESGTGHARAFLTIIHSVCRSLVEVITCY